ncbi:MAG: glycosyltransferase family 2 protein [Pirellula sp.]
MPRLSLIVPFQCDSQALENTLVSVLELRSPDDELLIVHRGEYQDPYGLQGNEAKVLETPASTSLAEQLNIAVQNATGDVLQVVLPGTVLEHDWCVDALAAFDELDVDMIALGVSGSGANSLQYGFEADLIPQRLATGEASKIAGPLLAGTMIRRSAIECLGGWNTKIPGDLIDFELCLMAKLLGIQVGVVEGSSVTCDESRSMVLSHYELGRSIGQLACAFSEISDSAIVIEPLVRRLGHLASGLVSPKLAAERLGWVLGVRDRSWSGAIGKRVESAQVAFADRSREWERLRTIVPQPNFQGAQRDSARKAA